MRYIVIVRRKQNRIDEANPDSLRESALRLLGVRARSRAELRKRLIEKGYGPAPVDALIDRFTELGLLDDKAFASDLISYHRRVKPLGRFGLTRALILKGIDKELASELVNDSMPADQESEVVFEILSRELNQVELDQSKLRKLFDKLRRRGFSYRSIESALRRLKLNKLEIEPIDNLEVEGEDE